MSFKLKPTTQHENGFTLVELLVVISIIGILAALVLVNLSNVRERGRDSARKTDLSQLRTALRLYYNDNQTYPTSNNARIVGCGASGDSSCEWGEDFGPTGTKYITLPVDPLETQTYLYQQTNGGDGFQLITQLENLSDPQAASSQIRCGILEEEVEPGVFMICAD